MVLLQQVNVNEPINRELFFEPGNRISMKHPCIALLYCKSIWNNNKQYIFNCKKRKLMTELNEKKVNQNLEP